MNTALFLSYIAEITRKDVSILTETFFSQVSEALDILEKKSYAHKVTNPLLISFAAFLQSDIFPVFDTLTIDFFSANEETRLKHIETLSLPSHIKSVCTSFLKNASYEEFQNFFLKLMQKITSETKKVVVQSARECTPEIKKDIRNSFGSSSFVIFKIHKGLLGGLKVFSDGAIVDTSWIGKMNALESAAKF